MDGSAGPLRTRTCTISDRFAESFRSRRGLLPILLLAGIAGAPALSVPGAVAGGMIGAAPVAGAVLVAGAAPAAGAVLVAGAAPAAGAVLVAEAALGAGAALAAEAVPATAALAESPEDSLRRERERLRLENAALRARLSLTRSPQAYVVADLAARRLTLELQGLPLATFPLHEVRMNRHAERLLQGSERISLLEAPFELQKERWFDTAGIVAWKDSTDVPDAPDTTGARMEAIRTQRVTALLGFDRRLRIVLEGEPELGAFARVRSRVSRWLKSWSASTPEGVIREEASDQLLVTLAMAPADVRSLAPNLSPGTRLILVL